MDPDEAEIRGLIGAYCERLDSGDFDGVGALFERGVFRSPAGTELIGVAAVRSQYDALIVYPDGTPRTKHVLGTVVVEIGPARATATSRCAFTVYQQAPGHPLRPELSGRYHDTFVRQDGAWWFEERMVHPDLWGDMTRHMTPRR